MAITISVPGRRGAHARILRASVRTLRSRYRAVRVRARQRRRLGRLPAEVRVLSARSARGTALRILVATARGRRGTYLLHVFSAEQAPAARLVEGQRVLRSLRLPG